MPRLTKAEAAHHFWAIVRPAREVYYAEGVTAPEVLDAIDELEVLRLHADWPLLSTRCDAIDAGLARDQAARAR